MKPSYQVVTTSAEPNMARSLGASPHRGTARCFGAAAGGNPAGLLGRADGRHRGCPAPLFGTVGVARRGRGGGHSGGRGAARPPHAWARQAAGASPVAVPAGVAVGPTGRQSRSSRRRALRADRWRDDLHPDG